MSNNKPTNDPEDNANELDEPEDTGLLSKFRALPQGRFSRLARMAMVGMRSGANMLVGADSSNAAAHAAEVLGNLRGLAAKVGQMASYVDGVVPDAHRDAYEKAMKTLRSQAPVSRPEQVKHTVETELQGPLDKLFVEWDEIPFASASIGQVHRALLHDGREVAVKVQHPGITKAIESDLSNAGIIEHFAGIVGGKRVNSKALLKVVRDRFTEELDYTLEAKRIEAFRQIHQDYDKIKLPTVISDRSSSKVMTTEFVRGASFDQAITATEQEKVVWCETLWRFVFRGSLVGGLFNADPHPGNYIFHENGTVTFLDFGCVQEVEKSRHDYARKVHLAACNGDERTFRENGMKMVDAKEGPLGKAAMDYLRLCFEPIFTAPFAMTKEYVSGVVNGSRSLAHVAMKATDREFFSMPPQMLFMNRLQFGFYSVLARFEVPVDYRAVERQFVEESVKFPTIA